jgi:hypothetical protein
MRRAELAGAPSEVRSGSRPNLEGGRRGSHEDNWNEERPGVSHKLAKAKETHGEPEHEDGQQRIHAVHQQLLTQNNRPRCEQDDALTTGLFQLTCRSFETVLGLRLRRNFRIE